MTDDEAIKVLKDLYDYGNLPERCLQALEKGMSALKYQRAAKAAIEKSAETVRNLQSKLERFDGMSGKELSGAEEN